MIHTVFGVAVLSSITPGQRLSSTDSARLDTERVTATIERVADWQLAHPASFGPRHWAIAPLYDGLIDASLTTGNPRYLAAVVRAGERARWRPGSPTYHADAHAAGHAWLRIYLMNPRDSTLLEPFKRRFEQILAKPIPGSLSFISDPEPGVERTDRWTWADALYMAPPTLALLTQATGDARYMKFADHEFKAAYDALFDPKERLFYRDARFIGRRAPNGQKVFWSRGNGWVYAGLALLLDALPEDYPNRKFYVDLFRDMSPAVLGVQQPDGLWYPSLKDPKQVPIGETSGSALFLFGLAWGVRHGLIDRTRYWPAVERGWHALQSRIQPNGAVEFVQPIGAAPESFDTTSRAAYGTGAVLMAGSEILRAIGGKKEIQPARLLAEARWLVPTVPDLSVERRQKSVSTGPEDRAYAVQVMTRIAEPVLDALSRGELKKRLPVHEWEKHRAAWTHYEALARTLAGIAPWLELGPDSTPEGRQRAHFIDLARRSLMNATDPHNPDYMNFGQIPDQPYVESAYLAAALLTAPNQLWKPLTRAQRKNVTDALRITLKMPLKHNNNWYLFPAMIEAALWQFDTLPDPSRLVLGVNKLLDWYVGDGVYGDGPAFHWDYYNSYVIQPMLLQVLKVAAAKHHPVAKFLPLVRERAVRYAETLERLISPEGTFPVMGRSSAYRFAAFYHLGYMALTKSRPDSLDPGAVRAGITAVVRRMVEAPGTFDKEGWLNLGAVGSQPGMQEVYNATGSLYVCLTGLVQLGLPPDDPFWTAPSAAWTQKRIWAGEDVPREHALPFKK
jgi:rhamnogalacturonyl hydrolase YesR